MAGLYKDHGQAGYANLIFGRLKDTGARNDIEEAKKFVGYANKTSFTKKEVDEICGKDVYTEATTVKGEEQICKNNTYGTYKEGKCYLNADAVREEARNQAVEKVNALVALCDVSDELTEQKNGTWWKQHGGQLLGGIVGAGAGAGLAYAITKSVQDAELDKAEQTAIQEFMDNVGSKIHCYIGSEEVGTYGDVISTSME